MTLPQTLIAFIIALGTLVVIHELGHYWVARWCGVKVLRFSVGMGRIVWSRRYGADQTEWAISILPLGGYVKMLDAREAGPGALSPDELKREFTSQNVWKRIAIVSAGPFANFLLAVVLFAGLYAHGVPEPHTKLRAVPEQSYAFAAGLRGGETVTAVDGYAIQGWAQLRWKVMQAAIEKAPVQLSVVRADATGNAAGSAPPASVSIPADAWEGLDLEGDFLNRLGLMTARPPAVLGRIAPNGPAAQAGLEQGDLILAVNGERIADGLAFRELMSVAAGQAVALDIERDGRRKNITVVPEQVTVNGQAVGRIGVEVPLLPETVDVSLPLLEAVQQGAIKTWDTSLMTLRMLGKMVTGEVSWKNMTGPITIADYAGQTARIGLFSYISFIAFISISLGIMNLLPIPVLDGGLLLYYSLEVLTGRPISERAAEIAQRAGVSILMLLMAVAVFNDIRRLIA
ncbi:MAG TPA: RIP metalloprotease RseP [Burkholderiaceae bacterium]